MALQHYIFIIVKSYNFLCLLLCVWIQISSIILFSHHSRPFTSVIWNANCFRHFREYSFLFCAKIVFRYFNRTFEKKNTIWFGDCNCLPEIGFAFLHRQAVYVFGKKKYICSIMVKLFRVTDSLSCLFLRPTSTYKW